MCVYVRIIQQMFFFLKKKQNNFFLNFFHKRKLCIVWNLLIAKIILIWQKYLFWGYSKWRQSAPSLNNGLLGNVWWLRREIDGIMDDVHGEGFFLPKNVYKRAKLFKEDRNRIQDEDMPHRSAMASPVEIADSVNALILADKKVMKENISEQLDTRQKCISCHWDGNSCSIF